MGKFINTQYFETQDKLVQMNQDLVQNPFYLYNDKKGTRVTYYNINKEKSTVDPGSKIAYTDLGGESPIRFNIVHDLYLYQFIKAELNLDNGEYGLEAAPLQGESYILPNTIVPTEGDFFEVEHIKDSTWLFKVTDVQRDTLDNGNNVYKIGWQIDRTTHLEALENVVEEFKYVDTVEGTNLKAVVKLEKYDIAKDLDNLSITMVNFFKDLFYNEYVQTFIYKWYNEFNMYDPFAIEFIIRNNLLSGTEDYTHVQHQCPIPNTFTIDYNKSLWRAIEERSVERLINSRYKSQADYIDYKVGIFQTRYEKYWKLTYSEIYGECTPYQQKGIIPILSEDMILAIMDGEIKEDMKPWEVLMIKYFNNMDIYKDDLKDMEFIELESSKDMFYILLITIYIIDFYIKTLLS